MAEPEKIARRTDDAERARHIAASETIAFGTTAGTMLLGLLGAIETAQAHSDHAGHGEPALLPAAPAHAAPFPADPMPPASAPPHDSTAGTVEQHATMQEPPAHEALPAQHADLAAESAPAPEAGGVAMVHALLGSLPEWDGRTTPADHGFSRGAGSVGETQTPASAPVDLGGAIQHLAEGVTGIIDTALAAVSQTISQVGSAIGHLTSTLSDTLTHLTDGLSGTVSGLIHELVPVGTSEPPALSASSHADAIGHPHEIPLLDTAGAIPLTLVHPPPLHLGFLGQPTLDGHDPHDGAFSALGVHHF